MNHLFQKEATKQLRRVQRPIELRGEASIVRILRSLKTRDALALTPFPFSAFEVDLDIGYELGILEGFAKTVGPHVERYSLKTNCDVDCWKVIILLSQSPNLTEFIVGGKYASQYGLSEGDLACLPISFPRLRVIGITTIKRWFLKPWEAEIKNPHIDLMLQRAPQLKLVKLPGGDPFIRSRIIQFYIRHRPNSMPSFSFNDYLLVSPSPTDTLHLHEFMALNLVFKGILIEMDMDLYCYSRPEVREMQRVVSKWLEAQRINLVDLCIKFRDCNKKSPLFPLPSFPVLRNLTIKVNNDCYSEFLPLRPFVGNPFPALEKLCLYNYQEDYKIFRTCKMLSVHELGFRRLETPLKRPSWKFAFPNLTSLRIEFDHRMARVFRSTLTYILTHLTNLEHLDLDVVNGWVRKKRSKSFRPLKEWGCWDLLTGRVPRPGQNHNSKLVARTAFRAPKKRVNGIYRVPSLWNMKGVPTFVRTN